MHWGEQTSAALAALRTLALNDGWEDYGQKRQLIDLHAA